MTAQQEAELRFALDNCHCGGDGLRCSRYSCEEIRVLLAEVDRLRKQVAELIREVE